MKALAATLHLNAQRSQLAEPFLDRTVFVTSHRKLDNAYMLNNLKAPKGFRSEPLLVRKNPAKPARGPGGPLPFSAHEFFVLRRKDMRSTQSFRLRIVGWGWIGRSLGIRFRIVIAPRQNLGVSAA